MISGQLIEKMLVTGRLPTIGRYLEIFGGVTSFRDMPTASATDTGK
jgi:hypothetical protein